MPKINNINELPEGIFRVNLKTIDQYQRKDASLMDKYKTRKYKIASFCKGRNSNVNLIICEDKYLLC